MKYVKVSQTTKLTEGSKKKISINGKDILLTNVKGVYSAIDNTCTHMGGSLVDGDLQGNEIVCPRHGSIFNVQTGQVVQRGKLFMIKVKVTDLKAYPVKIEGTDLLIGVE
jgi:3-phenylpropionate/trans-cinnamate dioxygenase ferredoxin subunit